MRVVSVDTIHPILFSQLEGAGHEVVDVSQLNDSEMLLALENADGIVMRSRLDVDSKFINDHLKLKFIGRVGSGLENVDQIATDSNDVVVFTSPEGNRDSVAEHALAMLLAWLNNIVQANSQVKGGQWERNLNKGEELKGKTVALIGYGNTGSAFAKLLLGFGVRVLAYDKYRKDFKETAIEEVSMGEIYRDADVVSLHIPLNDETNYLVNQEWLASFSKPIVLINTSRGKIVQTDALITGLQKGQLRGCCLDVLEYENARLKMPDFSTLPSALNELLSNDRVILSPHCAGLSPESYYKLSEVMANKIIQRFGRA